MDTQLKECSYTVFNFYTGAIVQVGRCVESRLQAQIKKPLCQKLILGKYNPMSYYIDPNTYEAKEKKKMILIVEDQTIKGVPDGSTLRIRELTDDTVTIMGNSVLEIEEPGKYHIDVFNPQYHPGKVTVEVL